MTVPNRNPYVGLRPYEEDEGLLFFGRTEQVTELLQRLHQHRFVAVVGGSGSGKSSLLRAGLIPNLKAGYLVSDSDHWLIAIMKPGRDPLFNMAASLLRGVDPNATREDVIAFVKRIAEQGVDAVLDLVRPLRTQDRCNFFLLVDQFEELFRFAMGQGGQAGRDESIDFVNIILELSRQEDIPFHVVLTMRSDFIGDCAQFFGLPEALNTSQYLVPRMTRSQLKLTIEGPARLYNTPVDPELTSRLMNDLGKVKDELPLLSHVLMRAWEHEKQSNRSGLLDLKDYESVGGIEHALSRHADEALAEFSEEERGLARNIFQELTAIDDQGRKIRRPASLSELKQVTGAKEDRLLHIVRQFIRDNRSFLILSETADGSDRVIDISHESLIRQWERLNEWVTAEGEAAQTLKQLVQACRQRQLGKKGLLDTVELQNFLAWRTLVNPRQAWADRYTSGLQEALVYLNESEAEERKRKEEERKAVVRKWRVKVSWLTALLLSAIVVGGGWIKVEYDKLEEAEGRIELLESKADSSGKRIDSLVAERKKLDGLVGEIDSTVLDNASSGLLDSLKAEIAKRDILISDLELGRIRAQGELEAAFASLRLERRIPKCPNCSTPPPPLVCLSPTVMGKLALLDLERMKSDPRRDHVDSMRVHRAMSGALDALENGGGGSYQLSSPTRFMRIQDSKLIAMDESARLYRMHPEKWPDPPGTPAPVLQDQSPLSSGGRAFLDEDAMLLVDRDGRMSLCSLTEKRVIASVQDSMHEAVTAMTTLMNNQVLVTGHEDGLLIWWTVQTDHLEYRSHAQIDGSVRALLSHGNKVYAVDGAGRLNYSGGLNEPMRTIDPASGRLTAITSTANGKIYAGSDGGDVWMREPSAPLIWGRVGSISSNAAIDLISVSNRGDIAVVSTDNGQSILSVLVRVPAQDDRIQYRSGLRLALPSRPTTISMSPDGNKIYLAYADGSVVRINTTLDAMSARLINFVGTPILTPAEEADRKACIAR